MNICVYGAASNSISEKHVQIVGKLGEALAERGHTLVFGGGSGGAMGAAARGAKKGGAKKILAVMPRFLNLDGVLYEGATDVIYTDTMHERKRLLEDNAEAFIVTPGGIGTFDELFEILSLKQLARMNKPIVLLNSEGYFDAFLSLMKVAIDGNFMSDKNLDMFFVTDDVNAALDYVENYKVGEFISLSELKDVNFDTKKEGEKTYGFFGGETPSVSPINELFGAVKNQRVLYDLLEDIWCEYSCAPRLREKWSESNKTLGQCSITSFLVQDIFGGKVYGVPLSSGGVHCFNEVNGVVFDLTSEQFGEEKLSYTFDYPQTREEHFKDKDKFSRYEYIKRELLKKIK